MRLELSGGESLNELSKALKELDPALGRGLAKAMKLTAAPAVAAVKAAAVAQGLHRAADATRATFSASKTKAGVQVVVSAKKAPYARPLEGGSDRNRTSNRHPVFGNTDVWVAQPLRPFFFAAFAEASPVDRAMAEAVFREVDAAIKAAGFH